jgi:hypothetical protein
MLLECSQQRIRCFVLLRAACATGSESYNARELEALPNAWQLPTPRRVPPRVASFHGSRVSTALAFVRQTVCSIELQSFNQGFTRLRECVAGDYGNGRLCAPHQPLGENDIRHPA